MTNTLFTCSLFSKINIRLTLAASILILQGCGGGGDAKSTSNESIDDFTPVVTQTGIIAFNESSKKNQPVELFLYYPDDSINNIRWQQTTGSKVVFHAGNSKGIAFTPSFAGDYSFQVSFIRNGQSETLSHAFSVSNEHSQIAARLSEY